MIRRAQPFVEQAGLGEVDALAEIHATSFARSWSGEELAALLASPDVFALAVRRRSSAGPLIAGFVVVRVAADEAEVLSIAVRPKRRRAGYGRLLMEAALRRLYDDGVGACFLEVDRANRAAVGLYGSLGFEAAGERSAYSSDPARGNGTALVMRAQLR